MLASDIPLMTEQLNRLADVFEKKQPTQGAIQAWFDTLREFRTELVMSVLLNIPKRQGKWPTPYEVWKICNDLEIDRREAMRKAEDAMRAKEIEPAGPTPRGREIAAQIRAFLHRRPAARVRQPGEDDE